MLPVKIDDFLHLRFPAEVSLSPDGQYCAWLEYQANDTANNYDVSLMYSGTDYSDPHSFLCEERPKSFFWESSDTLLFYSSSKQKSSVFRLSLSTQTSTCLMTVQEELEQLYLLSSGELVLLIKHTFSPPDSDQNLANTADEIPFWSNGRGFTSGTRNRLYIWKANTLIPISVPDSEVVSVTVHETDLLYTIRYHIHKKMKFSALCLYHALDGTTVELVEPDRYDIFYAGWVGSEIMVVATDMALFGNVQNPDFFLLKNQKLVLLASPDLGVTNDITSDARFGVCRQWDSDGSFLYFIATVKSESKIYRIDRNGQLSFPNQFELQPSIEGEVCSGLSVRNGHIAWIRETPNRCGEVWTSLNQSIKLSSCNDAYFACHQISLPIKLDLPTTDLCAEGFVILPPDFDERKHYPGVLQIHGGPKLAYGSIFHLEMQAMASEGLIVFFCNPHGSDGHGNHYMDLRGKYGTSDYTDLMHFTDLVLQKIPQLDSKRLAVCGGSYGGFMVNWIIGHTNRFCCAVSQRSISNWFSMFQTGDTGYRFVADQLDGTPWSHPERYLEQSPFSYAPFVTTPTLFIHSDQDYRCFMAEGIQMFTALRYFNVPARLCLIHGENHELCRTGRPHQRIKRLSELFGWINHYLKI